MTRNEYIASFNHAIDTSVNPLSHKDEIVSVINRWINQIEPIILSSGQFEYEIDEIAGRLDADDIKKTFKSSRLLSYLVNKTILNRFGVEIKRTDKVVGYQWFGDVVQHYYAHTKNPGSMFTNRWMYMFEQSKRLILKSIAKIARGEYRTVHPIAANMITVKDLDDKLVEITVVYPFFTPVANQENIKKYRYVSAATSDQLFAALSHIRTVKDVDCKPFTNHFGWDGYKLTVELQEVKYAAQPTDKEIYQQNCEKIMNAPKEPTTLEELIDALNDPIPMAPTPITKSKLPEVIALEKAYDEALEENRIATEEYTRAKKKWEETTNRLDRLEQALELLK